jgi:NADPH:quinone reductase
VLVEVVSTALNRADLLQRRGFYPEPGPPREHEVPGMELAGRVAAVGGRVERWKVGDEVMAIVAGGAYAERVAVHERQLMAVPAGVAVADAAALPEVGITAHDALVVQGGLRPGGWALVHAGGVRASAPWPSRSRGAGRPLHRHHLGGQGRRGAALGAQVAVDYERPRTSWRPWPQPPAAAGSTWSSMWWAATTSCATSRALRVGGTIVQVGVMGGGTAEINLGALLPKRATSWAPSCGPDRWRRRWRRRSASSPRSAPPSRRAIVRPVIDRRFPLADIAEAHRYLETNANVGKVLIDL